MAFGQAEVRVELLADGPDRAVADDRERGVNVHARREAVGRLALFCPRPGRASARRRLCLLSMSACDTGRAGPDLDRAGALHLRADPLHELAHREHQAAVLVQKRRRPRQIQRVVFDRQRPLERANHRIRRAQRGRAPAGADRVEQIKNFFLADRRGHRNLRLVEIGKRCPQSPRLASRRRRRRSRCHRRVRSRAPAAACRA